MRKCPLCQKEVAKESDSPFCSNRCQMVDLNHWLEGTYRIPTQEVGEEEEKEGEE